MRFSLLISGAVNARKTNLKVIILCNIYTATLQFYLLIVCFNVTDVTKSKTFLLYIASPPMAYSGIFEFSAQRHESGYGGHERIFL